jgi:hypothetical protein
LKKRKCEKFFFHTCTKKRKRDNQFEKEPKNSKNTHKKMPKSGINT